jgi:predicted nucleotidyltransferase
MLNKNHLIDSINENLSSLNAKKIILFGSYAYGTPNENSDIDLCIIEDKIDSKIKEKTKIRNLLKDIKISKDILVEEEEYFLTHSDENWINTALYDARHKGIVIYEQK